MARELWEIVRAEELKVGDLCKIFYGGLSGMPVMHEPGEPIQVHPGKCSESYHRRWKGQTE